MRGIVGIAGVALLLVIQQPAAAQDDAKDQAAEAFAAAEAAELRGDFQTAYDQYEQAYKLVPHPDVLYNMASVSERLGKLRRAVELYRRYIDESDPRPADAPKVERIVIELEKRIAEQTPDPEPAEVPTTKPHTSNPYTARPPYSAGRVDTGVAVTPEPASSTSWRVGVAYGFGFGDVPVERYQVVGSLSAVKLGLGLEFSAGLLGRNDVGIGAGGRYWFDFGHWRPFVRVVGTVGLASNDAASDSGKAFPMSVETGLGISFAGTKGEIYAVAGPRFTFGGVTEDDTLSDSHINDTLAVTLDVGLAFGSHDHTARTLISTRR